MVSGILAFQSGIEMRTIPEYLVFGSFLSIGLGGVASLFTGTATLTLGKFFKATGTLAVFIFFALVILRSLGIYKSDIGGWHISSSDDFLIVAYLYKVVVQ
jgi:hypothetical protein